MLKQLVPDFFVNSISEFKAEKLKEIGINAIILDLDNTLDSHKTKKPSAKSLNFLNSLKARGFSICVISNGKYARVEAYLAKLDIPFVADADKPTKKSYRKALEILHAVPENTAFVGDQIFTDIWGANRCGLTTVLTEPIERFENPLFYLKRALEWFVKAKIPKE